MIRKKITVCILLLLSMTMLSGCIQHWFTKSLTESTNHLTFVSAIRKGILLPRVVVADQEHLYVVTTAGYFLTDVTVRRYLADGSLDSSWVLADEASREFQENDDAAIAFDEEQVYLSIEYEGELITLTNTGSWLNKYVYEHGNYYSAMIFDHKTNTLLAATSSYLYRLNTAGEILDVSESVLAVPCSIVLDTMGNIYVGNIYNGITILDAELNMVKMIEIDHLSGLAIDHKNRLYVTTTYSTDIDILDSTGQLIAKEQFADSVEALRGIDIQGNFLYVADHKRHEIRKYLIKHDMLNQLQANLATESQ